MKEEIPYYKLMKLAIITAPLFGILGAAPAFAMNRTEFSRITNSFLTVTLITFLFWLLNILLLRLSSGLTFKEKNWIRYSLSILLGVVLVFILFQYILPNNRPPAPKQLNPPVPFRPFPAGRFMMPVIQSLSINIIILVLTELIILKGRKQKIETENTQLHLANLEAKHNQLKQQLHPHFLFNSLNTLKSLIKKSPLQAEEYLVKLSDLLRFSIYANRQDVVSLEKELELCINYLNMQKVRFNDALNVETDIPQILLQTGTVPVYSIQLLVENAIKHNSLTTQQPLHIKITGSKENSTISVSNNLQPKITIEDGNGVGLSNLSERYRLLGYKSIDMNKENGKFTVTIKVLNNESSDN